MIRRALLLLLFATSAAAQPFVHDEVRSWTMETPVATMTAPSPGLSLATDAGGLVIAWSAGNAQSRVSVARLDGSLRVVDGTQRDLPTYYGDGYDATNPQVVPTASGYAAVWIERKHSLDKQPDFLIFARLSPAFEVRSAMQLAAVSPDTRIHLSRGTRDDAIVATTPFVYTVHADGGVVTTMTAVNADDVAAIPQHTAWVTDTYTPSQCGVSHPALICVSPPPSFSARAYADGAVVDSFDLVFPPSPLPTGFSIAASDSGYLVTWIGSGNVIFAARVPQGSGEAMSHPLTLGTMNTAGPYDSLPAAAFDGQHWMVVWQQQTSGLAGHDIVGSVIGPEGSHTFTIAGTSADEKRPTVVAVARGVFVVGYEVETDFSHRQLAGRYLTFLPMHQRPGGK